MTKYTIILFLLPTFLFGQKIDHTISFRDVQSDSYFRFNYENDYFAATDENYTQGYNFELVLSSFEKNPLNLVLFVPKESATKYGLAIEHIGYTPNHYEVPEIQVGDRPFAAAIILKSFVVATDTIHTSRLVSSLSLGLIGPGTFGEEMQAGIHKATGNKEPLGWHNQIKNDVVLNYRVSYEKQLLKYRELFTLQGGSSVQLGTLFTNVSLGFNTTIGIVNSPFTSTKKGFVFYFYSQPTVNVIGYDATLQGGVFNQNSPYTISNGDIERFTAQLDYGLILQTRTLYVEFSRSLITKEISTLGSAAWGGMKFGFTF
ncbi:MAG: lipid A deacylase LpxR family protein [Aquaticitalea sp.]